MSVCAAPPLSVGDVVDLPLRFGNQVRVKCCQCKCYMSVTEPTGVGTCVRCRTTFGRQENGLYSVVSVP